MKLKHPKTGFCIDIPNSQPVLVKILQEDGKIIENDGYRHKVDWVGSGKSLVSYCNACGSAIYYGGDLLLDNDEFKKARVCSCGAFLGFGD